MTTHITHFKVFAFTVYPICYYHLSLRLFCCFYSPHTTVNMQAPLIRVPDSQQATSISIPVISDVEQIHANLLDSLGNLQHLLSTDHKVSEELNVLRTAYSEGPELGDVIADKLATRSAELPDEPAVTVRRHSSGEVTFEFAEERPVHAIAECIMCTSLVHWIDFIYADCGHAICRSCTVEYFTLITEDESAYPPCCCRDPIPLDSGLRDWLGRELVELYLEKELEYKTLDRTYCANRDCLAFISPESWRRDKSATCSQCEAKTCTWCKSLEHDGRECKLDDEEQALMDLSKVTGWKKCWRCGHWWEKDGGCDHIG